MFTFPKINKLRSLPGIRCGAQKFFTPSKEVPTTKSCFGIRKALFAEDLTEQIKANCKYFPFKCIELIDFLSFFKQ